MASNIQREASSQKPFTLQASGPDRVFRIGSHVGMAYFAERRGSRNLDRSVEISHQPDQYRLYRLYL